jgi:anionic cell wall polymer biosynthesis LytR-Cps2A-Psr (LCP) family protein
MNGARALIYARTRHPDSDFGRMQRQQQVLGAIGAKVKALGAGGTLAKAGSLTRALNAFVVADMSVGAATNVLWDAWRYGKNPHYYVVDRSYTSVGTLNGSEVLLPNRPAILRLVNTWAGR